MPNWLRASAAAAGNLLDSSHIADSRHVFGRLCIVALNS